MTNTLITQNNPGTFYGNTRQGKWEVHRNLYLVPKYPIVCLYIVVLVYGLFFVHMDRLLFITANRNKLVLFILPFSNQEIKIRTSLLVWLYY